MKLALLLVFAGCGFNRPSEKYACTTSDECTGGRVCDDGFCVMNTVDAPMMMIDADPTIDAIGCNSFAARHFDACAIPLPAGGLSLQDPGIYTYNTDDATLTPPSGPASTPANQIIATGTLISVDALAIGSNSTLRVIGARPLIVASWSTIVIDGDIDVSSNAGGGGAGANPLGCGNRIGGNGASDTGGGGGGGGGGFRGTGGAGGTGSSGGSNGGNGGGAVALPLLLGGCGGGTGGVGDNPGGAGGRGGGAIQLTARLEVTIRGTVHAGGAGGRGAVTAGGADSDGGGGGGGSGGMIGIEAPTVLITATAILAANGGGGGEGANSSPTTPGQPGAASATRALGGDGADGGFGALGSGGAVLTGDTGDNDDDGGGGGGGGAGYIAIKSPNAAGGSATVSPSITVIP